MGWNPLWIMDLLFHEIFYQTSWLSTIFSRIEFSWKSVEIQTKNSQKFAEKAKHSYRKGLLGYFLALFATFCHLFVCAYSNLITPNCASSWRGTTCVRRGLSSWADAVQCHKRSSKNALTQYNYVVCGIQVHKDMHWMPLLLYYILCKRIYSSINLVLVTGY